jgi:hypothetical protein
MSISHHLHYGLEGTVNDIQKPFVLEEGVDKVQIKIPRAAVCNPCLSGRQAQCRALLPSFQQPIDQTS